MAKTTTLALMILSMLFSCTRSDQKSFPVGLDVITVGPDSSRITFSRLVDSITFIPLETTPDCLMGSAINKIVCGDSTIFILEGLSEKTLFAFDYNGKFKFKIKRVGKGPGEFTSMSDFCITPDHQLAITDEVGKKIIFFDHQGVFLREMKTDNAPYKIANYGAGECITIGNFAFGLINIIDKNGDRRKVWFEEDGLLRDYENWLIAGSNGPLFSQIYDNAIYSIKNDTALPAILVDFQDKGFTRSDYTKFPVNDRNGRIEGHLPPAGSRSLAGWTLLETNQLISFYFFGYTCTDSKNYLCFHDKVSGKTVYMNAKPGFDDLFGFKIGPYLKGTWGNRLINPIDAHRIVKPFPAIQDLFKINRPDLVPGLEKAMLKLDEYSNPVLLVFSVSPEIFR